MARLKETHRRLTQNPKKFRRIASSLVHVRAEIGRFARNWSIPDRLPIGYILDRKLAESGYDKEAVPRFNRIPKSKWEIPLLALRYARKKSTVLEKGLGRQSFHRRVAMLVNEHTTCAAEMVALFAQERGLATIVGMPTLGRLVSHRGFEVGHGFTLVVPTGAFSKVCLFVAAHVPV